VALSPDSPENATEMVSEHEIDFRVFSDSGMAAARAFGVAYQVDEGMVARLKRFAIDLVSASGRGHQQLPVPAVFLVDAAGKVAFQYVNPDYSVRLAPEVRVAAARSANAQAAAKAAKAAEKKAGK